MSQPLVFDLQVDNKQAVDSINAFFSIYEKGVDGMSKMMADALGQPVEKKITIQMEGDKLVAKEVDAVSKSVDNITAATKAMNGEYGKTPNEIKKQLRVLKIVQGDTQKYKDGTREVTEEWKALLDVIKKLQERLNKLGDGAGTSSLTDKLISSQVAADALMGSFRLLTDVVAGFVRTGADMEVLFIQLQGFTGGVQQASDAYQKFVEIGQATPFTAKQVATAARTMMGFGIETSQAIDQVERLSIVAAATGGELTHMARNMGQIQANQKAYTRDLMQFANQGIPIYQEMADLLGVSTQKIREMAEEGQVKFGLVSAAIRNLTKEGTAFAEIATLMDATFAAKFEAIESGIENFAGRFMAAINAFDAAIGGPLANTLQAIINALNTFAEALTWISQNMRIMAPIIGAVSGAMAVLIALTIAANWAAFISALKDVLVVTKLWAAGQTILNTALAVGQALTGNIPALLLAAGVAAGGAAIAYNTLGKSIDKVNQEEEKMQFMTAKTTDDIDEKVFAVRTEIDAYNDLIDKERERYEAAKENLGIAQNRAEMAVQWIQQEYDAFVDSQKEEREMIKEKQELQREGHSERMDNIRDYYDEALGKERDLLDKIRERFAMEREDINDKTFAEQKLSDIRRRELELKARGIKYSRTAAEQAYIERLEAQAALDRLDRSVALEKNRADEKKAVAEQEKNIKGLEKDKDEALQAEKALNEQREAYYERRIARLDKEKEAEKEKVEEAKELYEEHFNAIDDAQFDSHEAAMKYLNDQILEAGRLERAMVTAANNAKKAWQNAVAEAKKLEKEPVWVQNATKNQNAWTGQGTPFANNSGKRASGGPVAGGSRYTVNELGKEAFLSAKGRLSMINAPAFGEWRAPSNGTVIPAHLTSQLDIPAGGVDISGNPGMNASGSSSSIARAIGAIKAGDNISNNVTIQSSNPQHAAHDALTQLRKFKRVRYH